MRLITMSAAALIASVGLANAQATNTAPQPGTAKSLSGTGSDIVDPKVQLERATGRQGTTGANPQSMQPSATQGSASPAAPPSGQMNQQSRP